MSASPLDYGQASSWITVLSLAALLALSGCSSTETAAGGAGGEGAAGGTRGGVGGSSGTGGTGGEEPPPPPRSTGVVLDSGGATLKSDQYEMDVSIGGPVGKGKAHSPEYMLDYYIPASPER